VFINVIVFNQESILDYMKYKIGLETIHLEKVEQIMTSENSEMDSPVSFELLGQNIIALEGRKIRLYDKYGSSQWEKEISSEAISVYGNNQYLIVIDQERGELYSVDYLGNINGEAYGLGRIMKVSVSESSVACLLEEDNLILVFDMELNETSRIPLSQGDVLGLEVSDFDGIIAVSQISIEENILNTKMLCYKENGSLISALNFPEELVYGMQLVDGKIYIVGEKSVRVYSITDGELWKKDIENVICDYAVSKGGILVFNEIVPYDGVLDEKDTYNLRVFDLEGNELFNKPSKAKAENISVSEKDIAYSINKKLYVLGHDNSEILSEELGNDMQSIEWLEEDLILIEHNNFADIYEITF